MKIVSINIEKDKHLEGVRELINFEDPQVVTMMEVREKDLKYLVSEYKSIMFAPNLRLEDGELMGVVLASKTSLEDQQIFYCDNLVDEIPSIVGRVGVHRPVVVGGIVSGIRIFATHFTWTPDMSETEKQKSNVVTLIDRLGQQELVMCGDFNIPRDNGTYKMLADRYDDNIPASVLTTIDPHIHRVNQEQTGQLAVVVDYIWSTKQYEVRNVRVISGVSDHCALVGEIEHFSLV